VEGSCVLSQAEDDSLHERVVELERIQILKKKEMKISKK